jgi:hypothetical protein
MCIYISDICWHILSNRHGEKQRACIQNIPTKKSLDRLAIFLMKTYNMHFLLTMHHSFLCLTHFWLFHPYAKSRRFTLNIQILINIDPTVIQYSLTHCCYWNITKMLIWVLKSCFHINVPRFKMLLNLVAISQSLYPTHLAYLLCLLLLYPIIPCEIHQFWT